MSMSEVRLLFLTIMVFLCQLMALLKVSLGSVHVLKMLS